ncbi:MAG: hypothetical protein ABL907_03940 [Hyphomicrobium sp.]
MPKKRKSTKPPSAQLCEPLYLDDYKTDTDVHDAWTDRWRALFDQLGLDISKPHAFRDLASHLAEQHVPGFKVSSFRPGRRKTKPPGRQRLVHDRTLLIASLDRLRAMGKMTSAACASLVRMESLRSLGYDIDNPFYRYSAKKLANQHYQYANDVRASAAYFAYFPESLCRHKKTGTCFTFNDFEDCHVAELGSLCRSPRGCPFSDRAESQISTPMSPLSAFERFRHLLNPKRQIAAIQSASLRRARALSALRRFAMRKK